jgi:hypothetical protein
MTATWIAVAIIVITVSMMAYPIAQLIPRPADKRRMQLRQAAMKLGFQIQMRSPKIDERLKPNFPNLTKLTGYYIPCKIFALNNTYTLLRRPNNKGEWFWLNNKLPQGQQAENILSFLNKFTLSVEACQLQDNGIVYFMNENQITQDTLVQIKQMTQ